MIGFPAPAATHADHHVLALISDILGSDAHNSSRLYNALMEPQLALECSSYVSVSKDPDLFMIKVTANGYDKIKLAEKAVYAELERLKRRPIGQRELARSKRINRNSAADVKSDPMKHAEQVCEAEAIADWSWIEEYNDKYDAVTSKDIMRVADSISTSTKALPAEAFHLTRSARRSRRMTLLVILRQRLCLRRLFYQNSPV